MPLLTLHTRLTYVLDAARELKTHAAATAAIYGGRDVSLGELFELQSRYAAYVDTICTPYAGDAALHEYAAVQFGDPDFGMAARIAGIAFLLGGVVQAVADLTTPHTRADLNDGGSVRTPDGSVPVGPYPTGATAGVRHWLNLIAANIPE